MNGGDFCMQGACPEAGAEVPENNETDVYRRNAFVKPGCKVNAIPEQEHMDKLIINSSYLLVNVNK